MKRCADCLQVNCLCDYVDKFYEEHQEVMEDLAELEALEQGKNRCLVCFNYVCKCGSGHQDRLNR